MNSEIIKKCKIISKDGQTRFYDSNNTDLTQTLKIINIVFEHTAGQPPIVQIEIRPDDIEIVFDQSP